MNQQNLEKVIKLRHELHHNPELSGEETWTKNHLMEFLKNETNLFIEDRGKWFFAYKKATTSKFAPIAFRADFDAVAILETCKMDYVSKFPGVGHKCGHDGHSAALCGFALEVDKMEVERDVYFIFQYGEEMGIGGEECAKIIEEKGIEEVFAFHNRSGYPLKALVYKRGLTQCASKGIRYEFVGAPAHASQPEDGINPGYAVGELITYSKEALNIGNFKEMVLSTLIYSTIGQENFGIAASKASVGFTIRANREDEMIAYEKIMDDKASNLAKTEGLTFTKEILDPFPETKNSDASIDKVLEVAKQQNLQIIEMPQPWRASEDFGYYTKKCNGAMIYIGNGEDYPMVHTSDYDFNDDILPVVIDLFVGLLYNSKS